MKESMVMHFVKYHGTGNDFILIDDRGEVWQSRLDRETIAHLCHRRFGIGADGLMLLQNHPELDFRMVYFNSDGRESTMCGNGGRCISAFARRLGIGGDMLRFEAIDGVHQSAFLEEKVQLKMGKPRDLRQMSPDTYWLHTGSPHFVGFEQGNIQDFPVFERGKAIRHDTAYEGIGGTNANFVQVMEDNTLFVRTFERGVEDETFSCGTGVTAAAYAYLSQKAQTQKLEDVAIQTLGGELTVTIEDFGTEGERVYLQGPATFVFEGEMEI
ncbi:MAG: diaminopimelate epimerase [Bacteroidota bacterium]